MKKNVIVFGLLSGIVISAMMLCMVAYLYNNPGFDPNAVLGYAASIAAFSFIFVGIRNYRNKFNGGYVTFGQAFKVGLYISLIASTMYVAVWLVDYYVFVPDFMDKYTEHVLEITRKEGATPAELAAKAKDLAEDIEVYKNPLMVILITYSEILPVALVVALVSALILKKKEPQEGIEAIGN